MRSRKYRNTRRSASMPSLRKSRAAGRSNWTASPARPSALGGALETALHSLKRHARPAARQPAPRQIVVLDVLDLAHDCLARVIALAAAGFPGKRVKPFLNIGRQTKSEHLLISGLLYMYSSGRPGTMAPSPLPLQHPLITLLPRHVP